MLSGIVVTPSGTVISVNDGQLANTFPFELTVVRFFGYVTDFKFVHPANR